MRCRQNKIYDWTESTRYPGQGLYFDITGTPEHQGYYFKYEYNEDRGIHRMIKTEIPVKFGF